MFFPAPTFLDRISVCDLVAQPYNTYPYNFGWYLATANRCLKAERQLNSAPAASGRLATIALANHPCPPVRGGLAMNIIATCSRQPWSKGKLVGQKTPLRLRDIWAIRVRLQIAERTRDLTLFDLAIDSKLRACDLTKLRVRDVAHG